VSQSLADLSGIRAIYFDLDDTLCGYWDASKGGLRAAFEAHAPEGHTADGLLGHWATAFREFCPNLRQLGWYERYLKNSEAPRTELMRRALERASILDEDLAAKISHTYMVERDRRLALFDDAVELLDWLAARYPLGLITNGPADLQRMEIATLGIADRFQAIFIEGEMGFGKPAPEVFRLAEEAFHVTGREILFVGNSYHHDIAPAIAAGWRTAWIRRPSDVPPSAFGGTSKPEELPFGAPEPDWTVNDLRSLMDAL
jgi:putative hydrolase of the HAD superfamily